MTLLASLGCDGGSTNAMPEVTVWIDEDLFEAVPGFLESRRAPVALLRQTLESGDREFLRQLAHKLKGSFGMYGFKWAAQICRELEDNHRTADLKILALQVDALEQHLAHVNVRSRAQARGIFSAKPGVDNDVSEEKDPSD
ncbi:Hpt domain protein [compost metagenome]